MLHHRAVAPAKSWLELFAAPRSVLSHCQHTEPVCNVLLGRRMETKLNVSREGLILLGMERTAACCVSLLSALFANVRICRLVASFGVSHQRIFHIKCYIRLHLGPALLTYSGGRLSPDCISFFLQGQHWQVYSLCQPNRSAGLLTATAINM